MGLSSPVAGLLGFFPELLGFFGRQAMEEDRGCFTSRGYLSLSGDEWQHEHVAERPHREAEKKPSIRERLEQGKKECANRQATPQARGKSEPEL